MYVDQSKVQALFKPQFINEVFEKATEQSFVLKHGTRLPNMTGKTMDMDILSNLPMSYWVGADTDKRNLTTLALENKRIYAEEAAVIVPISLTTLHDSNVDLKKIIQERLSEATAALIDSAVITGVNKPKHFREALIPSCINLGAKVDRTTDDTLYTAVDKAMAYVEESDYEVSAFAGGLNVKSKFRNLLDKNGRPVTNTEITDMPKLYVKNGAWDKKAAELLVGDFKQIFYAIRQEMDVTVLTEATIEDPITGAKYNLGQQKMIAIMVTMRLGWEIPNPISREVWENNPNYFPFAIVRPTDATTINNLDLTLTITDGTDVIEGASVYVGGNKFITNDSGVVTFKVQPNTSYPVNVFATGHNKFVDLIDIEEVAVSKTITLTEYDIAKKGGTMADTASGENSAESSTEG